MIIYDLRILKAISRKYGLSFDPVNRYCISDYSIFLRIEYNGNRYKLRNFDGCFYPYLVKI